MNFDWAQVKGMPTSRDANRDQAAPPPPRPRFETRPGLPPVKLDRPLPLLDLIRFCFPEDSPRLPPPVARLYDSLDDQSAARPRTALRP